MAGVLRRARGGGRDDHIEVGGITVRSGFGIKTRTVPWSDVTDISTEHKQILLRMGDDMMPIATGHVGGRTAGQLATSLRFAHQRAQVAVAPPAVPAREPLWTVVVWVAFLSIAAGLGWIATHVP